MLILNTFGPNFNEPDASPFCVKAMCLLRMSGLEWTTRPGSDSRKAPARKLPVLIDGDQTIADSDAIRYHLENQYGADFDAPLNAAQKAQSRALIRMVEEHLYFCLMYDRWMVEANWLRIKDVFFGTLPAAARMIVPRMVRKSVLSALDGQGLGRLAYDHMFERATGDLKSVEQCLTDGRFLFGDTAVAADASVGCVLAAIAASPTHTNLREAVRGNKRLMAYVADVKHEIYPTA